MIRTVEIVPIRLTSSDLGLGGDRVLRSPRGRLHPPRRAGAIEPAVEQAAEPALRVDVEQETTGSREAKTRGR